MEKTIFLLIDFEGHPLVSDEMTNNLRYSYLKGLLFNDMSDADYFNLIIVSDHTDLHSKMNELQKMSDKEGRHTWIKIDPDNPPTVDDIASKVNELGYEIQNVVVGGCNTVGCVFDSTSYSSLYWAKAGYPVQIFLPMCADYQMGGLNQVEVNMTAFGDIYNAIKKNDVFKEIDLISRVYTIWLDPKLKYVVNDKGESKRGIGQ